MKVYPTSHIRNCALAGHSGAGKTTLSEALLHLTGAIPKPGTVEAGNTVSDYETEELKRQTSINASLLPLEVKRRSDNSDIKINLFDCPGFRDFVGEIKNAIRVSEMALLVVDASTGVEVGTEFADAFADEYKIPKAFFINKMDKDRANFKEALASIEEAFDDVHTIPVTLPIGAEGEFKGVIDLLEMKAIYDEGGNRTEGPIPDDMAEEAKAARKRLVEAAAEGDDALTEKFLETDGLTNEEVILGLREDMEAGRFCPVLCGSSAKEIGLTALLNFLIEECPPPNERVGFLGYQNGSVQSDVEYKKLDPGAPFSAFVFKTVNDEFVGRLSFFKVVTGETHGDTQAHVIHGQDGSDGATVRTGHAYIFRGKQQIPMDGFSTGDIGAFAKLEGVHTGDTIVDPKMDKVIYEPTHMPPRAVRMAVEVVNRGEVDKAGMAIHKLIEQDPTLHVERDSMLGQTVLSGMGDTHLEVVQHRLEQAKIAVNLAPARVQYRETISKPGEGKARFKKQTGGRGMFADCSMRLTPQPRGEGFEFIWSISGGAIPTNYKSSVEKGVVESMKRGILAGYPVIDVAADCFDGSFHPVDSSDMAFQVAGSMAFKEIAPKCGPQLLEPFDHITIEVPASYLGDVMGYVSGKRGRILGSEQLGRKCRVEAEVPAAEMGHFSRDLRSMTQGRAIFESRFDHYEPVPGNIVDKVIAEVRIDHAAEEH
ncbi:MAG: elongation factor G [Sumerlaeia bacterium]